MSFFTLLFPRLLKASGVIIVPNAATPVELFADSGIRQNVHDLQIAVSVIMRPPVVPPISPVSCARHGIISVSENAAGSFVVIRLFYILLDAHADFREVDDPVILVHENVPHVDFIMNLPWFTLVVVVVRIVEMYTSLPLCAMEFS